jgi:hypothetical protein
MPDVQMDYEQVEAMIRCLQKAAASTEQVERAMLKIAQLLESGAFVNAHGARWADALRGPVKSDLGQVSDFLAALACDVEGALRDLRDGDKSAASRFSA